LKIVISSYLREKSSDFHEILYTAADFQLDERHVIKNEKVAVDRLRIRQNVLLVLLDFYLIVFDMSIKVLVLVLILHHVPYSIVIGSTSGLFGSQKSREMNIGFSGFDAHGMMMHCLAGTKVFPR